MMKRLLTGLLLMITALAGAQNYSALNGPFGNTPTKIITNTNGDLLAIHTGAGLYMSQDAGANWTSISVTATNDPYLNDIYRDEVNGKIYAISYNRFYTSSDGGLTWVVTAANPFVNARYIARGTTGNLFVVGGNNTSKVWRSSNGGTTWSERFDFGSGYTGTTDFKITPSGVMFFSTQQGVFKAAEGDLAASLVSSATGLTDTDFQALMINGTEIYALSVNNLFKSVNGGTNWTIISTGVSDYFYGADLGKDSSGNIFIQSNAKVWSYIAGTWTSVSSPIPTNNFATPRSFFVLSTTAWIAGWDGRALFKTSDSGTNWIDLTNGFTGLYPQQIVITDNDRLLIPTSWPYGFYLSTDDGATFDFFGNTPETQRHIERFLKIGTNIWGFGSGIIQSTNNGGTWTEVHDNTRSFYELVSNDGATMYSLDPYDYVNSVPQYVLWKSTAGGSTGSWSATPITGTGLPSSNDSFISDYRNFMLDANGNLLVVLYPYSTSKRELWKINASTAVATKVTTIPGTAAVQDIDTQNGKWYVLTQDSKLHISSDQGATWTTKVTPTNYAYIKVINDNTFYILNSAPFISTDGGATWVNTGPLGTSSVVEDVAISSTNFSYLAIPYAKVQKSNAPVVPPNPPSNLSVYGISTFQVGLKFTDNSNNEEYFILERSEGDNNHYDSIRQVFSFGSYGLVQNAPATQNTLTYYRVRAVGAAGKSAYSNEVSVTSLLNCQNYTIPLNRSWTGTTQNLSGMGVFTNNAVTITGGSGVYNISNLLLGWGASGSGITPFFTNPSVITGQIMEVCGSLYLSNSTSQGAARVISDGQGSWDPVTSTLTVNFQTTPNITPAKSERAVFVLNASDPVPAAVTVSAFIKTQSEITLTWNAPTFASQYQLQRSLLSGSGFVDVGSPTTTPLYVDTGLSTGTTYYYQVKAMSVGGNFTDPTKYSLSPVVAVQLNTPLFEALSIPNSDFATQGVAWIDIDNDNDDDLLVTPFGAVNQSVGVFENVAGQLQKIDVPGVSDHPILSTVSGLARDISVGDVNNDGILDFAMNGGYTGGEIYLNKGNKEFDRSTLVPPAQPVTNAGSVTHMYGSLADFNNDGRLDAVFTEDIELNVKTAFRFFTQNSLGDFELYELGEIAAETNLSRAGSWADIDNDNDQDFLRGDFTIGGEKLFRNNGDGSFSLVTGSAFEANTDIGTRSMSWADFDNDLDLDVFVVNNAGVVSSALFQNNGDGTFTELTSSLLAEAKTVQSFGSAWGDIDNDGDLDVVVANGGGSTAAQSFLYLNNGTGLFTKYTGNEYLVASDNSRTNIAFAFSDYDNNGTLDIAAGKNLPGFPTILLKNSLVVTGTTRWLKVKLVGTTSNKAGIGARIIITMADTKKQMRHISSESGYGSASSLIAHFGLKGNATVTKIEVFWPSGVHQVINTPTAANQLITITEDGTGPVPTTLSPANGATNVQALPTLELTLNEASTPVANKKISVYKGNGTSNLLFQANVTTGTASAGNKFTFTMANKLPGTNLIRVEVEAGAYVDVWGNPSGAISVAGTDPQWTFNTGTFLPPLSQTPVPGAVNVSTNTVFDVTFAAPATPVAGKFIKVYKATDLVNAVHSLAVTSATIVGNKFTFTLPSKLELNTDYTLGSDEGCFVNDLGFESGGLLPGTWSFKTDPGPAMNTFLPAAGATGVNANTALEITFNRPVTGVAAKFVKLYKTSSLSAPVESILATTAVPSGNKVTLAPSSKLEANTDYTVSIDAGAFIDASQNDNTPLATGTWTFKSDPGPVIASQLPPNGTQDVPANAQLEINFNRNVTAVGGKKLFVHDGANVTSYFVATTGTVAGGKYTLPSQANFPYSKTLGISIEAGAFIDANQNDFQGLAQGNWSFRVIEAPDTQKPSVTLDLTAISLLDKGFAGFTYSGISPTDDKSVFSVKLFHRKVSEKDFSPGETVTFNSSTQKWEVTVSNSWADDMGFEFYVEARDPSDNMGRSPSDPTKYHRCLIKFTGSAASIDIPAGGTKTSWRIISIPYTLGTGQISQVFSALHDASSTTWRMLRYQHNPKKWLEYPSDFTTIERGKGYFINSVDGGTVSLVDPKAPDGSRDNLYSMTLKAGWNQIGNPYSAKIDWDNVITFNNAAADVGRINLYINGQYKEDKELLPGVGGFVLAQKDVTVNISFPGQAPGSGRERGYEYGPLDSEHWMVPINVTQGAITSLYGGVGMSSVAKDEYDEQDGFNPPRFMDFAEMNFTHPEHFIGRFSRDVVAKRDDHSWEFTFDSNVEGMATFTWDNSTFGNGDQDLYLFDIASQMPVNMRETNNYSFDPAFSKRFKIVFGRDLEKKLRANRVILGNAFPNPTSTSATIPFALPENSPAYQVQIEIYDIMGRKMETILNKEMTPGYYQSEWSPLEKPQDGMYIYKLSVGGESINEVLSGKVQFRK